MQRRNKKGNRKPESFRPDDDVSQLLRIALGNYKLNKNRLINACVRNALRQFATGDDRTGRKPVELLGSDYERRVFSVEAKASAA